MPFIHPTQVKLEILPDGKDECFDWSTRTGRYAWRRELEEQEHHSHDTGAPFP